MFRAGKVNRWGGNPGVGGGCWLIMKMPGGSRLLFAYKFLIISLQFFVRKATLGGRKHREFLAYWARYPLLSLLYSACKSNTHESNYIVHVENRSTLI